ncbi:MAG: lysophospholipid acyltransferase family protein, partial [Polyangiales bacterium]
IGEEVVRLANQVTGQDLDARIGGMKTHFNEVGVDPFGVDLDTVRYALAAGAIVHRKYFRTEVFGIERVPSGRCLIVANHSGQLPIDGGIISAALAIDRDTPIFARCLVEKWMAELPFVSTFMPRVGQVIGTPENALRLLLNEETLVVFPEGARGVTKTFKQRYRLTEFGLGFMRLALATNTPIVPVAVLGGEEQYPSIADIKPLARMLGMPAFPVIPQVFAGMWAPLPSKYRLHFGAPFHFEGDPDANDAWIDRKVWFVRETIQNMVNRGLEQRRGIFV